MRWNVDFELSSILFQLIFVIFFVVKRHLPTKQNRYFMLAMGASFFSVVFDVITSWLDSYPTKFPIALLHIVNLIYFLAVSLLSLCFFMYILALTKQLDIMKRPLFAVYCIPFVVAELVALATPFAGFLYYFDESMNYVHGPCYLLEFITNLFYVIMIFIYITVYKNEVTNKQRKCVYMFCGLLVVGAGLQALFFNWVLLTNAITSTTLVIVYLSLQNPDVYIDKSTELFNGDAFSEIIEELMREEKKFYCIDLWIDDFPVLKALYGMDNVSAGMVQVAGFLKNEFDDRGVFRFGNNRFVIVCEGTEGFDNIREKIMSRFQEAFHAEVDMTFSASMTYFPTEEIHVNTSAKLVGILDFAKAVSEKQENGHLEIISEKTILQMDHDMAVERALKNAVAMNRIKMYYQPIVSASTKKIVACEALARLFDDEIGFIPPDVFIRKAEENGSILKLGAQIFEKVCQFLDENKLWEYGLVNMGINLSPIQCMQEKLAEELMIQVQKYHIPPELINLEITESVAMDTTPQIRNNMDDLIHHNMSFSLDDYGTGYSNMSAILQLPFEYIKIDKKLAWLYFEGKSSILPELINMFLSQNLKVIVEGVESEKMVEELTKMGCQYLQGFYFTKPLPALEYLAFMREFNRNTKV